MTQALTKNTLRPSRYFLHYKRAKFSPAVTIHGGNFCKKKNEARYLDPRTSRWMSADPAMGEYVPSAGQDSSKLGGMGGVYNTVNLHTYHYAGNNPVKYTDPDGRTLFYDDDGNFQCESNPNLDAVVVGSHMLKNPDGSTMTSEQFWETAGTIYAEMGPIKYSWDEAAAMYDVLENRAAETGMNLHEVISEPNQFVGYKNRNEIKSINASREKVAATIKGIGIANATSNNDRDYSNGSYFWEGVLYITQGSKYFNKNNWYVKNGWGTTPGTTSGRINYLENTRINNTVFMKYNPKYYGKRNYK